MPQKTLETPFPLIDADPHAFRVVRYMRPSDYGWWTAGTVSFPSLYYLWNLADPSYGLKAAMKPALKTCTFLGFIGGFLFAYQTSSMRFLGLKENAREYQKDLEELTKRAQEGKPLYGESSQPEWIQGAAYRNSAFSQFKFGTFPMFNLVNHPYHGTDPAKYGVKPTQEEQKTKQEAEQQENN